MVTAYSYRLAAPEIGELSPQFDIYFDGVYKAGISKPEETVTSD
jgi:hypothetical protein